MQINKTHLNKVLFEEKINNLKSNSFKKWAINFMTLKNIYGRLLTILIGSIFFSVIYFVLRQNGLDGDYGKPVFNKGSAFGSGSEWAGWTIYFIKGLVAFLFFVSFFIFNKWYCYVSVWGVFINSLCIIIDKSLVIPEAYMVKYGYAMYYRYDTVVDYFHFTTFVNNIGDIFIIVFASLSVITIIYYLLKSDWFKDSQDKNKNEVMNV